MAKERSSSFQRGLVIRVAGLLLLTLIIGLACNKELSCEGCVIGNQPPVAVAGDDLSFSLPVDSFLLDGSLSSDPDGIITEWQWRKISGPDSISIQNANDSITSVRDLEAGVYTIELSVRDDGGLLGTDTMRIDVSAPIAFTCEDYRPIINTRLVPLGTLSKQKKGIAVGAAGDKIVFAGGRDMFTDATSSSVDIYDVSTKKWSAAQLSEPRDLISVAVSGNKIFFAGGWIDSGNAFVSPSDKVDIYDAGTNSWSVATLSVARSSLSVTAVGNKVIFVGGFGGNAVSYVNTIDIYDLSTNSWSTGKLTEEKGRISSVTVGNKAFFAGGVKSDLTVSRRIDIYDNSTSTWSSGSLDQEKANINGIEFEGRIYWAGGSNSSSNAICEVEILNVASGANTLGSLSRPGAWPMEDGKSAIIGNKILFLPGLKDGSAPGSDGNRIDMYDVDSKVWSVTLLERSMAGASIISLKNKVYLVGGFDSIDQVVLLEF
jgi:N-acetylneuraminic acid mutarotase